MKRLQPSIAALALAACAGELPPAAPPPAPLPPAESAPPPAPPPRQNPLFQPSALFEHAPVFDQLQEDDFMPALVEGMRQQAVGVVAIADQAEPPTFENTIVAMERTGALLTRASYAFGNLAQALTDDKMQKIEADVAPLLAKHNDDIHLNAKLFARVHALYEKRDALGLDPVDRRLLERYHLDFVRAGALLNAADQAALRALNEEESSLQAKYSRLQIKETNAGAVVVDKASDLAGLSDADVAAAAAAAAARGLTGKWVIPLVNTTTQPALARLSNRALRERIYRASIARGRQGGENDVRQLVARLAQLRAERARILGFPSAAAYILDDQMAKTPEAVTKLLSDLVPPTVARAKEEAAELQKLVDEQHGGFKIEAWDWQFYAEQVRKAKYALDDKLVRPYLELGRVLEDGVFFAAHEMYGVTVRPRTDLPAYHPDVRVWEVLDADGTSIGLLYTDPFARESKHGGAWMNSYNDQSFLLDERPIVSNVLNVPKPAAGQPALLTFEEVTTMFHEFGHALHGLLSRVKYPYMSGTNTPRDFVEFPSQLNENWALEPRVLARYARHYETGAPMPAGLVEKVKKARTFNQGHDTLEALESQLLDLEWHSLPASPALEDPEAFEAEVLKKHKVDLPVVPPRYHTTYFTHVWAGGYQAGYYAYAWTAVLAADSFAWFSDHGGMTAENGKKYRDGILSRGSTKDAHQLYLEFRGAEPTVEAMLEHRGLVTPKKRGAAKPRK